MKNRRLASALVAFLSSVVFPIHLLGQQSQNPSVQLAEPHHQAQFSALLNDGFRYWDKGYLVAYMIDDLTPRKAAVVLYDREGRIAREGMVWFKDAESVRIDDAAVGSSGKLVVSGGTSGPAGVAANFIAAIDTTGQVSHVVRTTPFLPVYICAAEDGTVWSYGIDRDKDGKGIETSLRLRQYDLEKGQLRAMLDTSTLNSSGWTSPRGLYPGNIVLRCTSQKVGLYNGASGEWIEVDTATGKLKVAKVAPLPPPKDVRITGFALTESGEVFASMHHRSWNPPVSGLFQLRFDPSGLGRWIPVKGTLGPFLHGANVGRLLGNGMARN